MFYSEFIYKILVFRIIKEIYFSCRSADIIRVGELDFSQLDEEDADPEDVPVAGVTVHPNYKPPKYYNDIAVLKLSHSVEYSRYVQPICLPDPGSMETYAGAQAVLTGWGYLSFGKFNSMTY